MFISVEDFHLFLVVVANKFVSVGGKWYEKKIETILAAALSAILIWEYM